MSVRVYRGKHRDLSGPSKIVKATIWVNVLSLLISSLLWWLLTPDRKDSLTVFILMFAFSLVVIHSLIWNGFSWSLTFGVIAYGISFSFLALNNATGFPFGDVSYSYRLGSQFFSVPAILPVAWLTISYFAFILARRFFYSVTSVSLLGAVFSTVAIFGFEQVAIAIGYWAWLTEADQVNTFLSLPVQFYIATFIILLIILFMAGQLNRNEKLTSRSIFIAYLILTLLFFSILIFDFALNINAYWVLAAMGSTILIYIFGALKDN
jgi:uncharacterized membrane protein